MIPKKVITYPGYPLPLGIKVEGDGTQFAIFSHNAEQVTIVLFENNTPESPTVEVNLNPAINKTGDIWHIWIKDVSEGDLYGYRIDGLYDPSQGHRFNRNKVLLDPYAKAITKSPAWDFSHCYGFDPQNKNFDLSFSNEDSAPYMPRAVVVNPEINWYDKPLNIPYSESIIYEMHVKGFTKHPTAEVRHGGTYKGIIEKIPYLKELGINSIELLPIQEFNEDENLNINPQTGEKLKNYWGYSTISFFAPKASYASSADFGEQVYEFKELVRELHNANIEVILDIVFNHTAEGSANGPTINFRGIDNSIYYILEENLSDYKNYSGCGNTLNCNHPLVRDFILDCLRYWVIEMHVDGFRFDLASILGRDKKGNILSNPPLLERIEFDPILSKTKIIAEAWDAAGAYQVGHFMGRWAEWNGKFRDDIRRYWRGDLGCAGKLATRLLGSSDLYYKQGRGPLNSINFLTAHDGFTLKDCVSYSYKHNFSNGENNRDGENNNISYNFGIEGDSITPFIKRNRQKQIKNLLATLFLSQGTPMIVAGDEFGRTQQGNNNAYCQDNEISWIDWSLLAKNSDIFYFTKSIIEFRKRHPLLRCSNYFSGQPHNGFEKADIYWHGVKPNNPDWSKSSRIVSCTLNGEYTLPEFDDQDQDIHMIFNSSLYNINFELPLPLNGKRWLLAIDTSLDKGDIFIDGKKIELKNNIYNVKKQSVVVLISEKNNSESE